jgi:hypothetical protein
MYETQTMLSRLGKAFEPDILLVSGLIMVQDIKSF